MKIAFPIEMIDQVEVIGSSFGRTPSFLIHDTDKHLSTIVHNLAASLPGGAGIRAAQQIIDLKVEALITPQCGQNAMDLFVAAKVAVYQSVGTDLSQNIALFVEKNLTLLNDAHPGFHHSR